MKTSLLRFFLFLSICWLSGFALLKGQPATFFQIYDYQGSEKVFSLAPTADGGYIMSGLQGIGIGVSRIVVIKTDSLGNEEWHKIYGNTYHNESWGVLPLENGGYLVGAETTGEQINIAYATSIYSD